MHVLFVIIILTLLFVSIYMLLKKKLNIKEQTFPYSHINKIHKRGELLIVVVSILLLGMLAFVENTPPFKGHYFVASLTALYGFRALMEWKFEKGSKRYILSILASSFLLVPFLGMELIFTNPVPIKLNADQVKEISVLLESGQEEIILTNNPMVYPILSALSDATYQIGRWPVTPSTEMTIKLKDGKKVIIGEYKAKTLSGSTSTVFIVNAERILYPQDMIMYSPELEFIFDHLDLGDPDITGFLERNPDSTNKERTEKTLIFRGESKNWQAEYTAKAVEVFWEEKDKLHYSSEKENYFELQYKNPDIENVERVKYEYTTTASGGGGGAATSLNQEGILSNRSKSKGSALVRETDAIDVIVEWNDSEETFTMVIDKVDK